MNNIYTHCILRNATYKSILLVEIQAKSIYEYYIKEREYRIIPVPYYIPHLIFIYRECKTPITKRQMQDTRIPNIDIIFLFFFDIESTFSLFSPIIPQKQKYTKE